MIIEVAPFWDRANFGQWLTRTGRLGSAVEIGTDWGKFAHQLLSGWQGRLTCVDPWSSQPGYHQCSEDREGALATARQHLSPFSERVTFLRQTSAEAAPSFADSSLDFAYVDGDHRYEMVRQDLDLWWPKVRNGGVLAGHDFAAPPPSNSGWACWVQKAVMEFAAERSRDLYLVVEQNGDHWSWYLEK
jgi:predicted O-methyltransferase YrrM